MRRAGRFAGSISFVRLNERHQLRARLDLLGLLARDRPRPSASQARRRPGSSPRTWCELTVELSAAVAEVLERAGGRQLLDRARPAPASASVLSLRALDRQAGVLHARDRFPSRPRRSAPAPRAAEYCALITSFCERKDSICAASCCCDCDELLLLVLQAPSPARRGPGAAAATVPCARAPAGRGPRGRRRAAWRAWVSSLTTFCSSCLRLELEPLLGRDDVGDAALHVLQLLEHAARRSSRASRSGSRPGRAARELRLDDQRKASCHKPAITFSSSGSPLAYAAVLVERSMHPDWLSNAVRDRGPRRAGRRCSSTPGATSRRSWPRRALGRDAGRDPPYARPRGSRRPRGRAAGAVQGGRSSPSPASGSGGDLRVRGARDARPLGRHGRASSSTTSSCFTGDTLFKDAVGGGNFEQVARLGDGRAAWRCPTRRACLPGHTDETTIGREWEQNPFVRVWRGAEPEGAERGAGRRRARRRSIVWSPDYDGKGKAVGALRRRRATRSSAARASSAEPGRRPVVEPLVRFGERAVKRAPPPVSHERRIAGRHEVANIPATGDSHRVTEPSQLRKWTAHGLRLASALEPGSRRVPGTAVGSIARPRWLSEGGEHSVAGDSHGLRNRHGLRTELRTGASAATHAADPIAPSSWLAVRKRQ